MKSLLTRMRRVASSDQLRASSKPRSKRRAIDYASFDGAANCPLAKLPLELHLLIIDELDADDYLNALKVCRIWRFIWMSDEIWPGLAEIWLPGVVRMIKIEGEERRLRREAEDRIAGQPSDEKRRPRNLGPGHNDPKPDREAEQFRRMLQAARRRNLGRFSVALHHGMRLANDQFFEISTAVPRDEGGVHKYINTEKDPTENKPDKKKSKDDLRAMANDAGGRDANDQVQLNVARQAKPTYFRFMMYNDGRIAWWAHAYSMPYSAVVDDFRTGQRRMYDFPNHKWEQIGYTASMSSQLLIIGKGPVLQAWHLTKDKLATAEFPVDIERVFVEADRLLAVANTSDVFYWHHGREWVALDMKQLAACYPRGRVRASGLVELPPTSPPHRTGLRLAESGMLLDFILHPILADIYYVVTFSMEHHLCVHEMSRIGQRLAIYEPGEEDATIFDELEDSHGYLRWEKIDAHGGYCLMMIIADEQSWELHQEGFEDGSRLADCAQPDAPYTVVAICFNIYTKKFDFMVFHPPWEFDHSWHIWNGLLYDSDGKTGRDVMIVSRRCSLREFDPDMDIERDPKCYTTVDRNATISSDQETPSNENIGLAESGTEQHLLARRRPFQLDEVQQLETLMDPELPGSGSMFSHIECVLDLYQKFSPLPQAPVTKGAYALSPDGQLNPWYQVGKQRVLGDENFLVFVDDQNYTIWSFGDKIRSGKDRNSSGDKRGEGKGRKFPWRRK